MNGKDAKMKPVPIRETDKECLGPDGSILVLFRFSISEVIIAKKVANT